MCVYVCVAHSCVLQVRKTSDESKQRRPLNQLDASQTRTSSHTCVCACIDLPYIHFFRTIKSSALERIIIIMKYGSLWEEEDRFDVQFHLNTKITRLSLENDFWYLVSVSSFKCCCVTLHSTPTSARLWTFALCHFPLHHLSNPSRSATRGFVKPEAHRAHVSHTVLNVQLYLLRGT